MRSSLSAALFLTLLSARPAASVLTDDEPSNDSIGTAAVQIVPTAAVTTDGGVFNLLPDDTDYVGIGNLAAGDVVTVSTTPLVDSEFKRPDTFIGLFTSGGSRECENDDIKNNELWNPPSTGLGSLCRFVIDSAGTWFVGVTGSSDPPFEPPHFENGPYELHVTINALNPPMPTPTSTPTATPTAAPTGTATTTPTTTPTAAPTTTPTTTPSATPTAVPSATPTVAPSATPTATPPICLGPGASCSNNSDCCSNECSTGPNRTCQAPPTPTVTPTVTPTPTATPTPTPTPEPGVMLQLLSGGVGLAWLQRRRNRRAKARSKS